MLQICGLLHHELLFYHYDKKLRKFASIRTSCVRPANSNVGGRVDITLHYTLYYIVIPVLRYWTENKTVKKFPKIRCSMNLYLLYSMQKYSIHDLSLIKWKTDAINWEGDWVQEVILLAQREAIRFPRTFPCNIC